MIISLLGGYRLYNTSLLWVSKTEATQAKCQTEGSLQFHPHCSPTEWFPYRCPEDYREWVDNTCLLTGKFSHVWAQRYYQYSSIGILIPPQRFVSINGVLVGAHQPRVVCSQH